MSAKKIYLHIGTAKTGTTAIQQFLADNSERLEAEHGILYPIAGRQRFRRSQHMSAAHHRLAFGYYGRRDEDGPSAVQDAVARLASEVLKTSATTIVVSSEYFPGPTDDQILEWYFEPLSQIADVHTIVYFRRQDEMLESSHAQAVKRYPDAAPRPEQVYRRLRRKGFFDYFHLAEIWGGRALGRDRVHVRPYERAQLKDGDAITDFMSLVGVDDVSAFARREGDSNPSLTRDQILLIRAMHDAGLRDKLTKGMRDPYRGITSNDTRYATSPNRRQRLIDEFADSTERVAREYMGREDGVMFEAALPADLKPTWTPKDEPELRFLLRAVSQLIDDQTSVLRNELDRVEQQLERTEARLATLESRPTV